MKSFYEFNGNWLQIFDCLVGIISPANVRRFSIWESKSTTQKNLLIVYEIRLDNEWEGKNEINRISESEFLVNYRNKINDHVIHGFNEFTKNKGSQFSFLVNKITTLF